MTLQMYLVIERGLSDSGEDFAYYFLVNLLVSRNLVCFFGLCLGLDVRLVVVSFVASFQDRGLGLDQGLCRWNVVPFVALFLVIIFVLVVLVADGGRGRLRGRRR